MVNWADYGFRMTIQEGSLSANKSCDIAVKALLGGQFKFPDGSTLVSAVYAVSATRKFLEPATLEIQHCADVQNEEHCKSLQFVVASCAQKTLPYKFREIPGGRFCPKSQFGSIDRQSFSMVAIIMKKVSYLVYGKLVDTVTTLLMPVLIGYPEVLYHARTCYCKISSNDWKMEFIVAKNLDALKKVELIQ